MYKKIYLKPKKEESLKRFHPWVFSGAIDHSDKGIEEGDLVEVYDSQNNLLCYLYLENKTFINAHLIKKGLVTVDTVANYKYKSKFISY